MSSFLSCFQSSGILIKLSHHAVARAHTRARVQTLSLAYSPLARLSTTMLHYPTGTLKGPQHLCCNHNHQQEMKTDPLSILHSCEPS